MPRINRRVRVVELGVACTLAVACGSQETVTEDAPTETSSPSPTTGESASAQADPLEPALTWRQLDARGDDHLKAGRFADSVADFDAAIALEPDLEPYHWRRGIAHYYAGMYDEGAAQFVLHRSVNGADVENAAWHYLCVARAEGAEAARAALLPVGRDGRAPMMVVYEMFAGRATPEDVLARAAEAAGSRQAESALFYGHLYVGLYHEVTGDAVSAEKHIRIAATEHTSPHYMGDVARVHATLFDR